MCDCGGALGIGKSVVWWVGRALVCWMWQIWGGSVCDKRCVAGVGGLCVLLGDALSRGKSVVW